MFKNTNDSKKIIIFTPYYDPEPFPINNFVEELAGREEIEEVKIITSLPNYRNYKLWFWLLLCSNKITNQQHRKCIEHILVEL